MGVLPVNKAREAASKAYDELQIPIGSPPELVVSTFRTLCLQYAFHLRGQAGEGTKNNNAKPSEDSFQRQAVAYRFLRSLPLLEDTEYHPDAILARLLPLEEPRDGVETNVDRACAMLDVCITTMEQAQPRWKMPYTNYVITVHYCLRMHVVRRRYSEFEALHVVLQRRLPIIPALPERSWLQKQRDLSQRAQSLTQYLLRVVTMLANRGLFSLEIMAFLEIDYARVRADEEALALDFLSRVSGVGDRHLFYIVASTWLGQWKQFIKEGKHPPGLVDNTHLVKDGDPAQPKKGFVLGSDYRCLNFVSWQYLALVYSGGPRIVRMTADIYGEHTMDVHTIALLMQRLFRGFLGRRQAAKRRLYMLRQDPVFAKRLEDLEKQTLLKTRMDAVRKYVDAREYQIRHIAALKIQHLFRKYTLRVEHALLMAESAVPNAADNFQHVEEYFSLEEIGLIRDTTYRLAHFLMTMIKGVPIQKLRSRRKTPQWRLFCIDAIGSQLQWSSKKTRHALSFSDVTRLAVESPLLLKSALGRQRATTYDHAVVLSYDEGREREKPKEGETVSNELILICESQCDCDALFFGLNALLTETRNRTAKGATYVDGHGVIRKKYPHAKRLISEAQELIDKQLRNPFLMNQGKPL